MKGSGKPKDYPVFVSSQRLEFVYKLSSTYKQILTVYNIYNIPVGYNILATHPNLYLVKESRGVIQPQCCIDVLIRAQDFRCVSGDAAAAGACHRLRVQLLSQGSGGGVLGYRDVDCVMRHSPVVEEGAGAAAAASSAGLSASGGFEETAGSGGGGGGSIGGRRIQPDSQASHTAASSSSSSSLPLTVTLGLAGICVALLALPLHTEQQQQDQQEVQRQNQHEQHSWLWSALTAGATHHVKLVAAYALGLLTAALLRYN